VVKIVIIAVLAILVLVGGGFGALFATDNLDMVGLGGLFAEEEVVGEEKVGAEEASYVSIDQIIVPVFLDGRVAFQVYLDFKLEVEDTFAGNKLRKGMPRIQDAIIVELVTRPIISHDGSSNIDVLAIKSRVLKAIQRTAVGSNVSDVLITQALRGQ
jgi:flagellar basal body-associated protein FliL